MSKFKNSTLYQLHGAAIQLQCHCLIVVPRLCFILVLQIYANDKRQTTTAQATWVVDRPKIFTTRRLAETNSLLQKFLASIRQSKLTL